jgi:hypothetical protein
MAGGRTVTEIDFSKLLLRAHIGLTRLNPVTGAVALLLFLGVAVWLAVALGAHEETPSEPRPLPPVPAVGAASVRESADEQNLRNFYAALGNRQETEQALKTLFDLAQQADLSLDQADYQWRFDKQSGTYRYQILLPVKGAYGAIRRFCERALLALPFASLDEWSFKREAIGDDALDVSLRFTFYLKDAPRAASEMVKETGSAR